MRRPFSPHIFQGSLRSRQYFEGWYFKFVLDDEHFAVIPGISLAPGDRHAFVQVIRGGSSNAQYHRVEVSRFAATRDPFELTVGDSRFSLSQTEVRLPGFHCDLDLHSPVEWPATLTAPNTMGWYAYVPLMQCNHAVLIVDAEVTGEINGRPTSGRGYVEKDFGRSFPAAWVWLQSNSFAAAGTSVTCSIARVPFLGGTLTGVLAGVLVGGTLYRFATYTGVRLDRLRRDGETLHIAMHDRKRRLELAVRPAPGALLRSPDEGRMIGTVRETIDGEIDVRLTEGDDIVFKGTGRQAGVETENMEVL